jgi:hypothetical protein
MLKKAVSTEPGHVALIYHDSKDIVVLEVSVSEVLKAKAKTLAEISKIARTNKRFRAVYTTNIEGAWDAETRTLMLAGRFEE